jgi:hypothetical protein
MVFIVWNYFTFAATTQQFMKRQLLLLALLPTLVAGANYDQTNQRRQRLETVGFAVLQFR